jgi:hypothetical protein
VAEWRWGAGDGRREPRARGPLQFIKRAAGEKKERTAASVRVYLYDNGPDSPRPHPSLIPRATSGQALNPHYCGLLPGNERESVRGRAREGEGDTHTHTHTHTHTQLPHCLHARDRCRGSAFLFASSHPPAASPLRAHVFPSYFLPAALNLRECVRWYVCRNRPYIVKHPSLSYAADHRVIAFGA